MFKDMAMLGPPTPAPNSIANELCRPLSMAASIALPNSIAPHSLGDATHNVRRYPAGQRMDEISNGRRKPSCSKDSVTFFSATAADAASVPVAIDTRTVRPTSRSAGRRRCEGELTNKSQQSGSPDALLHSDSVRESISPTDACFEVDSIKILAERDEAVSLRLRAEQHVSQRFAASSVLSLPSQHGIESRGLDLLALFISADELLRATESTRDR
mmetsp:Transcript_14749/g.31779  ORF Transcript_14749/g.31779 Transcript_14749/m.31779 type:complete len:215 (-) Transcript_14749:446-1090(-)